MRITQSMMTRRYLSNLNGALANMSRSTQRIASGRKYEHFSENVSAGIKSVRVRENISIAESQLDTIQSVDNELASAESNLMSMVDVLSTIKEKVVKAQNTATLDTADRAIIADEIMSLRDQVLKTVNAQFDEKYLFGGTMTASSPFTVDDNGVVKYNGSDVSEIYRDTDGLYYTGTGAGKTLVDKNETKYVDIGLGMTIDNGVIDPNTAFAYSFSGIEVLGFGKDESGNSNNLISLLSDIAAAVSPEKYGDGSEGADSETLGTLIGTLTDRRDQLLENVTAIGTKTNFLEATKTRLEDDILNMKTLHKRLYEIDEATEITNEKMYEYSWNAILQIGSKVIPASLMDFLR